MNIEQKEYTEAKRMYEGALCKASAYINAEMDKINYDYDLIDFEAEVKIELEAWKKFGIMDSENCLRECRENLLRWGFAELEKVASNDGERLEWLKVMENSQNACIRERVIEMLLKLNNPRV